MKFTYTPERLTITCDEAEREELREILADNGHFSDKIETEFMERIVCNSELDWIGPADTGDMTDAPMLGVIDGSVEIPEAELSAHGNAVGWRICGQWDGETFYNPIVARWAYPHYAIRSFLSDLMESGEAVFLSNW